MISNTDRYVYLYEAAQKIPADFLATPNKKVLFVSPDILLPKTRGAAFIDQGYSVVQFNYRQIQGKHKILRRAEEFRLAMVAALIRVVEDLKPDIVKYAKAESLHPSDFQKIREIVPNAVIFHFNGDQRGHLLEHFIQSSKYVDYTLTSARGQVKEYSEVCESSVHFFPCDALDALYFPRDYDPIYDVLFAGGTHENFPGGPLRVQLMQACAKKHKTICYGGGWKKYMGTELLVKNRIEHEDLAIELSKAKLTLGINAYNDIDMYVSNRMWNHICSGTLHITHYVPGLEDFFTNNHDIVWFHTLEEALELVAHYLSHEDERIAIASRGRENILLNHTSKHRVKFMLKLLERD